MKESNGVRTFLIAAVVTAMAIPAIAGATPYIHINDEGQTAVRVSYADLDLSSGAGVAQLYARLRGASAAACGPRRSVLEAGSLQQLMNNKDCYNDLLSRLVAKVDNAMLSEIHAG